MAISNSQGKIWYGLHFVPGVAQYSPPNENTKRVYLNENTLRAMDPTFAGRPVFVNHKEQVAQAIDVLKREADGWVIESFFNQADGKHWVKFITTSEKADLAIRNGWRLSNAYFPLELAPGGVWNGVQYEQEITAGEFEHLAIVESPRYEESVIMTPEQFKAYNEAKVAELKKLSNSKQGENQMSIKFWKREAVKNEIDLVNTIVQLPKSGKEFTLEKLVNEMDAIMNMHGYANGDHMVKLGDHEEMSVNDLVKKHMEACNELKSMKEAHEKEGEELEKAENESDGDQDDATENESQEEKEKKENEKKENEAAEAAKREAARKAADEVREAPIRHLNEVRGTFGQDRIELSTDKVARGKARYGSQR